ncbi:SDR family oxidoreductase [Mycobacterium sp. Aquia_216]|uniref:SDR family NAD(P)-dependent oxidoreductase n=1 Tax=Mycobacterium sp. Aquia_216 TaxID=2991729 RepID=UPI00227B9F1E|nr:SDR family oxidoreductase [Mycobacterium sp. Aquia_216]WAJ44313.1 SDR family oxidoreductase [Mycobacterium sp. Aquia_216]
MGRLDGKVCLITNGVQPLGHATARRFAREGATVVVADADGDAAGIAEELAELGGRGMFVQTDADDKLALVSAVGSACAAFGRVDALVTGAPRHTPRARLEAQTDAMFDSTMKSVFYPAAWAMQAVLPVMRDQGGGRIVNYCAPVGPVSVWNIADFNAASTAIIGLTNTAAAEWARHRVLCNAVALPASIVLATGQQSDANNAGPLETHRLITRTPELENDVAPVALFLVSDDNAYVTGSTIKVDGGAELSAVWQPDELSNRFAEKQVSR